MSYGRAFKETTSRVSHVYRQLYPWKSKFDLAESLCRNILYNSDGIVALNKPFGVGLKTINEEAIAQKKKSVPTNLLQTHGGGAPYSLEDVLPILKAELKMPELVVLKAGDKYNTGVALLAENEKYGKKIHKRLSGAKSAQVFRYNFHIISPFTPYEGLGGQTYSEKVAIGQQQNPNQKYPQPVIVRDYSINSVKRGENLLALVQFSVNCTSPLKATLISVQCNDTKRNFLRIYCADMMMPILGDHLYSVRYAIIQGIATRLKPLHTVPGSASQVLPPDTKEALGLAPSEDTKFVPIHAHLHKFTIPNFSGHEKHLTITAPYPEYFKWTCSRLKLPLDST